MIRGLKTAALLLTVLLAQAAEPADAPLHVNVDTMTVFQSALYFVGTRGLDTTILGRVGPFQLGSTSRGLPSVEVVDRINGRQIEMIRRMNVQDDRLILTGTWTQYVFSRGEWTVTAIPQADAALFMDHPYYGDLVGVPFISFAVPLYMVQDQLISVPGAQAPQRRFLVWNSRISKGSSAPFESPGIYEITGDTHQFYKLPQPTYDLFQQYRPLRVKDGYTREITVLGTEIGPFQLEGGGIHLGLRFYDGEGYSGVGGIVYFDPETKRYHFTYVPELADWSASAIYVEPDTIWLGLVRHGEGMSGYEGDSAGGLARYERKSGNVVRYPIPAFVNVIRRFGNNLVLGTSDGIYVVVDGGRVEHLRF